MAMQTVSFPVAILDPNILQQELALLPKWVSKTVQKKIRPKSTTSQGNNWFPSLDKIK